MFPDIFITFTCNPNWPEITRYLKRHNLKPEDRPDLCCRVFKMKLDDLIYQLRKKHVLGVANAVIYTIEFQGKGLPHARIVLSMRGDHRLQSAEVVGDVMIHRPCGAVARNSVCMADGRCIQYFPRQFSRIRRIDDAGYYIHRRREDRRSFSKNGFDCDNGYVVPYNRDLCLRYMARINVEWCVQSRSVEFLLKYIHKASEYVRATVERDSAEDEIKKHFSCRNISACDSAWKILSYPIQYRSMPE